jgi:large subunit ribosomal protein L24
MTSLNPKLIHIPKHRRDRMVGATLADNLRQQYGRRSVRVIEGDSIRVMRGEYKGVEGKVEKVDTENGTLEIEGVQREKVKGGQVKVPIHASKVMVTNLKMDDKYRQAALSGGQKSTAAAEPKEEAKPKQEKKKKAPAKAAAKKKSKAKKPAKKSAKKGETS